MTTPLFLLFVGLGNPGKAYEITRHNIGAMVVRSFGEKHGWTFRGDGLFEAEIAKGRLQEVEFRLLLPVTYMNRSGRAVRKVMDAFSIPCSRCCVVVDDVYLSFGEMRLRCEGSSGGHNGLKSVEESLGSSSYPRLRMGVGAKKEGETLSDHVLGEFSFQEQKRLREFIDRGVDVLEKSIATNLPHLMDVVNFCNKRASVEPGEEK